MIGSRNLPELFQAFFYDWLDRNAAKKGKPLPDKIGSMQFFLSGFQGKLSGALRVLSEVESFQTPRNFLENIHGLEELLLTPLMIQVTDRVECRSGFWVHSK